MDSHDSRISRIRHQDLASAVDNLPDYVLGTVSFLGTLSTTDTYPTIANAYYQIQGTEVNGPEGESDVPSYVGTGDLVLALNLGNQIPPLGTVVIVSGVGGRWVFRYDGPADPGMQVFKKETPTINLAAAITVTTSPVTITVTTSTPPLAVDDVILIDSEKFTVTSVSGTSITCTRPTSGTTAATHLINTQVHLTTLDVRVCPGRYINADGCRVIYDGEASFAITASATRKLYLDGASSYDLTEAASYPGSNYVPLATITTDTDDILTIVDNRITFSACDSVPTHSS